MARQFFLTMTFLEVMGRKPGWLETIYFIMVVILSGVIVSGGGDVGGGGG